MRDPERLERILTKIREAWELNPDSRFCQLVHNIIPDHNDNFYLEDDDFELKLDHMLKRWRSR